MAWGEITGKKGRGQEEGADKDHVIYRFWKQDAGYRRLETGCWIQEAGNRMLETGGWKLEAGNWRLEECESCWACPTGLCLRS
jgi:hypothetical protein